MNLKNFIFVSWLGLVLFTGCLREDSENVNQDRIWAHYELYYNGNEDVTYVRATFRFGHALGTRLQLTEPSNVYFNNSSITWRPALGYYERSFPGFIDFGTFRFDDMNGTSYVNEAEIRVIDHPETVEPIDRAQAAAYSWDGAPVSLRETVTLILSGGNNGGNETFVTGAIGATELVLGNNQLLELAPGNGQAIIERNYAPEIQEATSAGGLVWGRYRAVNKTVVLE